MSTPQFIELTEYDSRRTISIAVSSVQAIRTADYGCLVIGTHNSWAVMHKREEVQKKLCSEKAPSDNLSSGEFVKKAEALAKQIREQTDRGEFDYALQCDLMRLENDVAAIDQRLRRIEN